MDEQKEETEGKEEVKADKAEPKESSIPSTDGKDDSSSTPLLDETRELTERREAANKETKELLDRQEKLISESALAGRSMAGGVVQKVVESPEEYANKFLKGEIPNILNIQEQ